MAFLQGHQAIKQIEITIRASVPKVKPLYFEPL